MKRALPFSYVVVACAAFVACQPSPAGLTEQDKAAFRKADEATVRTALSEKPDWPALAAELYAPDADLLPPEQPPVKGLDAIRAWYSGWPSFQDFKLTEVRREGSGDFAYLHYRYAAVPRVPQPVTEKGKGLTVFRKGTDGVWKNVAECWNSDAPSSDITVPTASVAPDANAELKKLGEIVGRWKFDGTWKADPMADAGGVDLEFACAWMAGGRHVVYRYSGTVAGVPYDEVGAYSYDAKTKSYRFYGFSSDGNAAPGTLAIQPGSWVHATEVQMGNKPAKARFTLSDMSPAGGAWRQEVSTGGGPWTVIGEGKYKKLN